jgi:hypothetical protein
MIKKTIQRKNNEEVHKRHHRIEETGLYVSDISLFGVTDNFFDESENRINILFVCG